MTRDEARAAPPHWSDILGVARGATIDQIQKAYRELAMKRHPDRGGSQEQMAELNRARDAAVLELQGKSS